MMDDYEDYIFKKYSIAVAIAIIKSKPVSQTLIEYISEIQSKFENETDPFDTILITDSDFDVSNNTKFNENLINDTQYNDDVMNVTEIKINDKLKNNDHNYNNDDDMNNRTLNNNTTQVINDTERNDNDNIEEIINIDNEFATTCRINDNLLRYQQINDSICNEGTNDTHKYDDFNESTTILNDVDFKSQVQSEPNNNESLTEILDIFNDIDENSMQYYASHPAKSNAKSDSQSTYFDSEASELMPSSSQLNAQRINVTQFSQINESNKNYTVNGQSNKLSIVKNSANDSQETELYTVHGFTENTHISQSQDNFVVFSKLHKAKNTTVKKKVSESDSNILIDLTQDESINKNSKKIKISQNIVLKNKNIKITPTKFKRNKDSKQHNEKQNYNKSNEKRNAFTSDTNNFSKDLENITKINENSNMVAEFQRQEKRILNSDDRISKIVNQNSSVEILIKNIENIGNKDANFHANSLFSDVPNIMSECSRNISNRLEVLGSSLEITKPDDFIDNTNMSFSRNISNSLEVSRADYDMAKIDESMDNTNIAFSRKISTDLEILRPDFEMANREVESVDNTNMSFCKKDSNSLEDSRHNFGNRDDNFDANICDEMDISDDSGIRDEIVSFKVVEELNRVKKYINRKNSVSDSGRNSQSFGFTSQSTGSHLSQISVNESGHCLFSFIVTCPFVSQSMKMAEEISRVLGPYIDKLHENENYPQFLDKILEKINELIKNIYEEPRTAKDLLKKDEQIDRLLLLNRSINIIKYTIEKLTNILNDIHLKLKNNDLLELSNLDQTENLFYIFHILEILLKRHDSMALNLTNTQISQEDKSLKRSTITEIWKKKWNLSKSDVKEGSFKKKCVLTQCSEILNKIVIDGMEAYSLISFAALQCFNLLQNK